MKKRFILVIFFAIFWEGVYSQPWASSGATWYYSCTAFAFDGYQKVEKLGDTLITGHNCDKFLVTTYGYDYLSSQFTTVTSLGYTYESNDTVFRFLNNQFIIFGIYSALPGDTWLIPDAGNCTDSSFAHVDSLGQIIIMSDTLLVIHLTLNFYGQTPYPTTFTRKLGYDFTMFPFWDCTIDFSLCGPFRCYSDSSGFSYSSNIVQYCDFTTGEKANLFRTTTIQIYPNPNTGSFVLRYELGDNAGGELQIFDVLGKMMFNKELEPTTGIAEKQVTLFLRRGVYFWRVVCNDIVLREDKLFIVR